MNRYGATHRLLVEHEFDGIDEEESIPVVRDTYVCRVFYHLEHPDDCLTETERERVVAASYPLTRHGVDPTGRYGCPIDQEIENVGFLDALGVKHWATDGGRSYTATEHLQEGVYELNAWFQKHTTAEGEDWSGGLEYERLPDPPRPTPPPVGFKLVTD